MAGLGKDLNVNRIGDSFIKIFLATEDNSAFGRLLYFILVLIRFFSSYRHALRRYRAFENSDFFFKSRKTQRKICGVEISLTYS